MEYVSWLGDPIPDHAYQIWCTMVCLNKLEEDQASVVRAAIPRGTLLWSAECELTYTT